MKVVLDTNVLLVSISRRSIYRPIIEALQQQHYELLVTSSILLEYEEIIGLRSSPEVASNFLNALQNFSNVREVIPHYRFQLIPTDQDDEKFADCAVTGQADYLVTEDSHFKALIKIKFPAVRVLSAQEFLSLLPN
ncbi:putative toxin-antitoxin system toxin component, PIN family [Hymenobacter profundi]|uniref:Toxin-antitoxin system toxin component, PIN family n=1 Tax=Hymenobacter profundi TaxID=1982110 RepID=A0ABS6X5T9_9BACT|nr:putative toxin-antitoxin system toxin component, PIN family [Hymenobacter profundi]MBW3130676.1 putative toxin-antitoxin system toxin component, PIN family [Hymenobacter profundi]